MELRLILPLLIEFVHILSASSRTIKLALTRDAASRSPLSDRSLPVRASSRMRRTAEAETGSEDGYNLFGSPGAGYYVEVAIGTPPQLVSVGSIDG